jgi:ubiquinone/menaquinone biosynthesis C-methylase UbiE
VKQLMQAKKTYRSGATLFRKVGKVGWKKSEHFTYTYAFAALRRWLVAQVPPQQRILSIGCGTGELEKLLEKHARFVIGIDLFLEMVKRAHRHGVSHLVQTNSHALPFDAESFDTVVLPETLGYVDPGIALREIARVLKKNGQILITTYPVHLVAHSVYVKRSAADVARALVQAGFAAVERRFLLLKHFKVQEIADEGRCSLLYLSARKRAL